MRQQIVKELEQEGIVAIIRMEDAEKVKKVVEAIFNGGMRAIEITMNVKGALNIIKEVRGYFGDKILLGVGTVLDTHTIHQAVDAGAMYIVSPILKKEMIEAAHNRGVPIFPGTMTPTEMQQAHEWGADFIKVFPAAVFDMNFIKLIKAPLPHLKLVPVGGITPENVKDWFDSGAALLGVGSAVLDKEAIDREDYHIIIEKARQFRRAVDRSRE